MQQSNNFRWLVYPGTRWVGDIGGPMCISNEYRWNVPVVTYGFDQSFLDFFGSNGVAAVEWAIQTLNRLPPASSIALTDYPAYTLDINYQAQSQFLYDLQSSALALLLERLGLAPPTRSTYVLRNWSPADLFLAQFFVTQRNFDPETLETNSWIDGYLFDYSIVNLIPIGEYLAYAEMYSADLSRPLYWFPAVAENRPEVGGIFSGLTADDVGGLRYLLSSNNVNYELLLPGISSVGGNSNSFVNGAWRPGVEKITFVRQPFDGSSARFLPLTNQFTDTYITNGGSVQQQLQRVVTQPDILFSAGDTYEGVDATLPWFRTGTSNWFNNAVLNGNLSGAGPGVIQPPSTITFVKLGQCLSGAGVSPHY